MKFNKYVMVVNAMIVFFTAAANADDTPAGTLTKTTDMQVKLTVTAACDLSVDDLDFGTHASTDGDLTAKSNATVTCTKGAPFALTAEKNDSYVMKNKVNEEEVVPYKLYSDSAHQTELTDTIGKKDIGTGIPQIVTIYGTVTKSDLLNASVGDYLDTVTLTLTY